jgi:hypothetical protein
MCNICYGYKVITVSVNNKEICFKCIEERNV